MDQRAETEYADIIDLPHHQSKTKPQMSLHDRAAQFAPFAALQGYSELVEDEAKSSLEKILISEQGHPIEDI